MKRHGEPRLTQRLNRSRLAEHACSGRNQHVLPAVGVHRVRDQAVDGGRPLPSSRLVSTVSMTVPSSSAVQRAHGADRVRSLWCAFASVAGRRSGRELRRSPTGRSGPDVSPPRSPRR